MLIGKINLQKSGIVSHNGGMKKKPTMLQRVMKALADTRGSGEWQVIADKTGVPYSTLTKMTCGTHTNPRINTVQRLADYFGLD